MKKIAKGDEVAFRTLVRQMGQKLFALAYRLMNNDPNLAEDAVQDTLIKLWTSAPNWQPTGTVQSYLMTILHHACMDLHRRKKMEISLTDRDDLLNKMTEPTTSAIKKIIEKDDQHIIIQAIHTLPERQRTAVLMSYYGDESHRQIAHTLGTSEGAVESLLARARKTLTHKLPALLFDETNNPKNQFFKTEKRMP